MSGGLPPSLPRGGSGWGELRSGVMGSRPGQHGHPSQAGQGEAEALRRSSLRCGAPDEWRFLVRVKRLEGVGAGVRWGGTEETPQDGDRLGDGRRPAHRRVWGEAGGHQPLGPWVRCGGGLGSPQSPSWWQAPSSTQRCSEHGDRTPAEGPEDPSPQITWTICASRKQTLSGGRWQKNSCGTQPSAPGDHRPGPRLLLKHTGQNLIPFSHTQGPQGRASLALGHTGER